MPLLEQYREVVRRPPAERVRALRALRRRALAQPDGRVVAALCLHSLAEVEADLDKRMRLQQRVVRELPEVFALRSLGLTQIARGRLAAAAQAFKLAILTAESKGDDSSTLSETLNMILGAMRGDDTAAAEARMFRVQTETDLAFIRARAAPKDGYGRLEKLYKIALRARDEESASLFLRGLVLLARELGHVRKEVRFARKLVKSCDTSWALELLGEAERRSQNVAAASAAYRLVLEKARREGNDDRYARAAQVLRELA
jgi:hypothetical protein